MVVSLGLLISRLVDRESSEIGRDEWVCLFVWLWFFWRMWRFLWRFFGLVGRGIEFCGFCVVFLRGVGVNEDLLEWVGNEWEIE